MKKLQTFIDSFSQSGRWFWLMVVMLATSVMTMRADEIVKEKNYKVTNYSDHVSFEIMIADLNYSNTWCEWGTIYAYSQEGRKGTKIALMDVETDDNGDDDKVGWDFYARNRVDGSKAFLTNPKSGDDVEIRRMTDAEWKNKKKTYEMEKKKETLLLTVKIDYYYEGEMSRGGKTWYFYYESKHDGGSSYNLYMGSARLVGSSTYDRNAFKFSDFSYSRKGANTIQFTTPALPDDVPEKVKDVRYRQANYILDFTYHMHDGTVKTQKENLAAVTGTRKTHDITIPEEVGNFKSVDLDIVLDMGYRSTNWNWFEHWSTLYHRTNIFTSVPVPFGLGVDYNQFDRKADLVWNAFPTGDTNYIQESTPYVYRVLTDKDGKPLSGETWKRRTKLPTIGTTQGQGYTDQSVQPNSYYKYMVVNVPNAWVGSVISNADLDNPSEQTLNLLGYAVSDVLDTRIHVDIFNLKQDTEVKDKMLMTWEYTRVPVNAANVKFAIMRRESGTIQWFDYGSVTAPANPEEGSAVSFSDTQLPNNLQTYDYKVTLSINDGTNTFESDVLTAGLLSGSTVRGMDVTKGMHENTVRVSWDVKQVGTANTHFVVSRRYAGTTEDFLQVYAVSGTSDRYTYEDNTVQPGYLYEYKVECYAGEKPDADANNFQNSMTDVGFSQARGVISGRVTFGSGSAVENVRLSLQASADDGNMIRGYSQRIAGASTGVVWDVDTTETKKVFGMDKDYTLQFFIRPEDDLKEGGVIAEIPYMGRLRLGAKQTEGYQLILEKYGQQTSKKETFKSVWRANAFFYDTDPNRAVFEPYTDTELGGVVYSGKDETRIAAEKQKLIDKGYTALPQISAYVKDKIACILYVKDDPLTVYANAGVNTWEGKWYDTGLLVPFNTYSILTLQNSNGEQQLAINDMVSSPLVYVSSHSYQENINEMKGDYASFRIHDEKSLYVPENLNDATLQQLYGLTNASQQTSWFPVNGSYLEQVDVVKSPFSVGGSKTVDNVEFRGNITEVRVWDHPLTKKEQTNYQDRILNGRESGLDLYWPMDEGINHYVFDASYSNDLPNGRHATVGNNIAVSLVVPTNAQLSRYGITNDQGEYSIRGIPFVGSGTTYTLTPTKGIHVFSPISRNGFVGGGSLSLNAYDFTDTSSFPMRGKITYLNTDIPADSIQFKIDGDLVQGKNKVIMSDANGEYEISVPIGRHLIECFKDGHKLSSFPLDGSTYDFKQAETVNFIDSTLVNVTGRINGGFSDEKEPVGFGRSKNRLGKATIKLSLGQESQCSFNYITDDKGEKAFGTTPIEVKSATENIKSTAYRAGGSQDETNYIYITTDPETGEFSAMLPPLNYKVESITFEGGKDYDDVPVFAQNLPMLNATNTHDKMMGVDSVEVNGVMQKYYYSAKMVRQYRADPDISVVQRGMKNGAFGSEKISVQNLDGTKVDVPTVTYTDKGYSYPYGYPLYEADGSYAFGIDIAEKYKNLDTGEEFSEVPADAIVKITNEASMTTTVFAEETVIDGKVVKPGEPYDVKDISVRPDKTGHVDYEFIGGLPNLADGHLLNMTVSVLVDNRTIMWHAPNSATDALDLILLGTMPSGTNFVTDGPDAIHMVLRRPPGSTSEAVYALDSIHTHIDSKVTSKGSGYGGGFHISVSPEFEQASGAAGWYFVTKIQAIFNTEEVWDKQWTDRTTQENDDTYEVTREYRTTTDGIQNNGDTYIGRATNMLFGMGRMLGLFKQSDGSYKIGLEDALTVHESFKTQFAYSQEYIEETLIPNWEKIIESKLITIDGDHKDVKNCPTVSGEVRYYTKYKKGDKKWGLANGDSSWSAEEFKEYESFPSYRMVNGTDTPAADEVEHAIRQIKVWKAAIAKNEEDKLKAFESSDCFIQNYSIAGGTSVSETTKSEHKSVSGTENVYDWTFNSHNEFGAMFNQMGLYGILNFSKADGYDNTDATETTEATSVSWTMSDGDPRTALSVDVFKSPKGWGPIFRTRGGQTANPYEDATYTKYFEGGGAKLDEATMRVEKPQLLVKGANRLSAVPSGGKAKFDLELTNLSEVNSACNYVLEAIESSNAKGAVLTIDGAPLSLGKTGRVIPMRANETMQKMLYVSQSDRSVSQYEELKLVLRSENDETTHSDTLRLSVEYVPASAVVDMSVNRTVVTNQNPLTATFENLDRQDTGLKGVRVQYRRKGTTDSWTQLHQWKVKEADLEQGDELLPAQESKFGCTIEFPSDGTYELRGQTFGKYGNDDVTYETDIIEVVQDISGPKLLGMPDPQNGLLTFTDRNDMHIRFNEPLNVNALSKSNIIIRGGLNNSSTKSAYTDVAVQLNGDEISTEANYTLTDADLAFDMWFYRQGDGNIISMGTTANKLSLYTHDGGLLAARVGDIHSTYETGATLPAEQWTYIALSYKRKSADDPENRITMLYANSDNDRPVYVGDNVPCSALEGQGKLTIGGEGMKGMMHDLTLWNIDKTADELYVERESQKAAYTPGLVGYWRMNEGHGTTLADKVRSRNMLMDNENWYINNRNLAVQMDGKDAIKVDISTVNTRVTDSYAFELWFRGINTPENKNAQLLSLLNVMSIGFSDGKLVLEKSTRNVTNDNVEQKTVSSQLVLSDVDYIDNAWHHLALNVRRGTSAIAYIDGEAVKTIPEADMPVLKGTRLYVGGEQTLLDAQGTNAGGVTNGFLGDIDEVRIWNAALTGDLIADRRYERLDDSFPGLVGYFPMESIHREETGNIVTDFSKENFGNKSAVTAEINAVQSTNAPALLPGSTRLRLADTDFDFTASEDEIYFSFKDDMLPVMDGNEFEVTVQNVKDAHNNNSEPVVWKVRADFAALTWLFAEVNVEKEWTESKTFRTNLYNLTGSTPQSYELLGLPTWLTVDSPIGTTQTAVTEFTFTIQPSVPVGRYTEYIYVSDSRGIKRALPVNITVKGDEPKWTVDPNRYESNMAMTAQIYVGDKISEYTNSKIAAFDNLGLCRGVGQPKYVASRDAYYVDMIVYGAAATEISSGNRELTFQMYDASTGIVHPVVNVTLADGTTGTTMMYAPDATYGSYDNPVVFRSTDFMQQTISLPRGWTWMSIYVQPESTAIAKVLPEDEDELMNYLNIKSKTALATVKKDGSAVLGTLNEIAPGNMYKMQLSSSTTLNVLGESIDVTQTAKTINPGFNWIGSLSNAVMSLEDAFAELEPEKDDMVKTRTAMAVYNGKGVWEGTLKNIVPGVGYIYESHASESKSFHYPRTSVSGNSRRVAAADQPLGHFQPVDDNLYPDNMNFIAVVEKDGQRLEDVEVAAFVGDECRAAEKTISGYYFLTVVGSSSDDKEKKVELRVYADGEEYVVDNSKLFISDAMYGTLEEPYVLDLNKAVNIEGVDIAGYESGMWYTLQGIRIGEERPKTPGIYLHEGKKVVVK